MIATMSRTETTVAAILVRRDRNHTHHMVGEGDPAKNQNRSHLKNRQRHNRDLGGGEGRDQ